MPLFTTSFNETVIRLLREGGIGVIRSDTLYGIVGSANSREAVERIYAVKGRTPTKSPIVLIDSTEKLWDGYDTETLRRLGELWPGKNSVILPSKNAPEWITRGNASVAYRLPDDSGLRELLGSTGPLVAPSANPEGAMPAMNVAEAKAYFGDAVDFYVDGGQVTDDAPSRLYRLQPDGLERLR